MCPLAEMGLPHYSKIGGELPLLLYSISLPGNILASQFPVHPLAKCYEGSVFRYHGFQVWCKISPNVSRVCNVFRTDFFPRMAKKCCKTGGNTTWIEIAMWLNQQTNTELSANYKNYPNSGVGLLPHFVEPIKTLGSEGSGLLLYCPLNPQRGPRDPPPPGRPN